MMSKARGKSLVLLKAIYEIQDRIGRAKNNIHNDRDPMMMDKVNKDLEKAFNICIEANGIFDPIST